MYSYAYCIGKHHAHKSTELQYTLHLHVCSEYLGESGSGQYKVQTI